MCAVEGRCGIGDAWSAVVRVGVYAPRVPVAHDGDEIAHLSGAERVGLPLKAVLVGVVVEKDIGLCGWVLVDVWREWVKGELVLQAYYLFQALRRVPCRLGFRMSYTPM